MQLPIRVGAVSYLNAKPLYLSADEFAPGVRLAMDLPSRLADRLAAGELDVALIPSVEYLAGARIGATRSCPGFAIAARGPVRSVKLFSRVPVRADRAAGARRRARGRARRWRGSGSTRGTASGRGGSSCCRWASRSQESTADAVLLIGDRAMKVPDDAVSRGGRPGRGLEAS